jgi:putative lipase involved disintegration of autophagic bodies
LITNITTMFPKSNIYLVGHSLGGSLASLLGTTFGFPAVAFEAPGERLAATRLHLPIPPSLRSCTGEPDYSLAPVTHVYHTADPIPLGACNGIGSPCSQGGYALETRCHLGKSIVYDTVTTLKWSVDIRKHPIRGVIEKVIEADVLWGFGQVVPRAKAEVDCVVRPRDFFVSIVIHISPGLLQVGVWRLQMNLIIALEINDLWFELGIQRACNLACNNSMYINLEPFSVFFFIH